MAIPTSSVVNVSISVGAQSPARAGFGTLNIVTNETNVISLAERYRRYSTIEEVTADWSSSTEVNKAATSYFSQVPRPTSLVVSVRYDAAQAAQLRSGVIADTPENLDLFTSISDGSFAISIDGDPQDITGMDFTLASNLDSVANTIETALQNVATGGYTAADVSHTSDEVFVVTSGTTGATSTITFLTPVTPTVGTDISELLRLDSANALKSDGVDAETITDSLDAIESKIQDWYGLMFTKEVRDGALVNTEAAVLAASTWIDARTKVFFNTSNDTNVLESSVTSDIVSQLKDGNKTRTISTYSSYPNQYPSASVAGRAFTTNFNQPLSTITLKFKNLPGITPEDMNSGQKTTLDSKNGNAFVTIGSSASETNIYAESFMANGGFFDEVHGIDWLTDAIQTTIFGYLVTVPTKVPYTNAGVAALQLQLTGVLDEGVRNGLIASSGTTSNGEFLESGYRITAIPVEQINQGDVDARNYPGLSFIAIGAGAIHSVEINGVFER